MSAAVLGFVLGLQHATDPDHLVAVATILTRERRFAGGVLVGVLWGAGHMATLALAGAVIITFRLTVGPGVQSGLEVLVAAILVALGISRLRGVLGGREGATTPLPAADHDHGGTETVHSHPHADHVHPRRHVHPSRRLTTALGRNDRGRPMRAVVVGAVHGLAGSAAASLLALASLASPAGAIAYLAIFALGTIVGMMALTVAMAYPVSLTLRFRGACRALTLGAGLGSIAFGLAFAARAF